MLNGSMETSLNDHEIPGWRRRGTMLIALQMRGNQDTGAKWSIPTYHFNRPKIHRERWTGWLTVDKDLQYQRNLSVTLKGDTIMDDLSASRYFHLMKSITRKLLLSTKLRFQDFEEQLYYLASRFIRIRSDWNDRRWICKPSKNFQWNM